MGPVIWPEGAVKGAFEAERETNDACCSVVLGKNQGEVVALNFARQGVSIRGGLGHGPQAGLGEQKHGGGAGKAAAIFA